MDKRDLKFAAIIGAGVGLLIQPIVLNLLRGSRFFQGLLHADTITPAFRAATFFFFLIFAPLTLWIAYFLSRIWSVLYQFAKFAAVGTLNTFINFGILNLFSLVTGITTGLYIPVFATISFFAATTNSYFWNKFWTFEAGGGPEAKEALKFYLVTAGGWALDIVAISIIVNYLRPASVSRELWLNVGALGGVAASFLWNFLGYKYFVFKKTSELPPTVLK